MPKKSPKKRCPKGKKITASGKQCRTPKKSPKKRSPKKNKRSPKSTKRSQTGAPPANIIKYFQKMVNKECGKETDISIKKAISKYLSKRNNKIDRETVMAGDWSILRETVPRESILGMFC